jgi:hypothetical protein
MGLEANDLPTVHGYVLCKFGSFWTHAIRERLILPLDVPQNRVSYDVLPWMTWLNKYLWFITMQYASRTAAMLPVWCLLFGWHLIVAELDCAKTALAMVLTAMLMMSSGAELAFSRRNAFVRHYLETGPIATKLRRLWSPHQIAGWPRRRVPSSVTRDHLSQFIYSSTWSA